MLNITMTILQLINYSISYQTRHFQKIKEEIREKKKFKSNSNVWKLKQQQKKVIFKLDQQMFTNFFIVNGKQQS